MKGKIDSTMLQILTLNSTLINSQCVLCPLSCYIEVFNKPDKFITVGGKGGSVPGTHLPSVSQGDHSKLLMQFFKMI